MPVTHEIFDHVLFALLLIIPLIEWRWNWPRYLARLAAGVPNVRLHHFRNLIIGEWIPVLCLLGYWHFRSRPFAALHLAGGTPWRFYTGLGFVAGLIGVLYLQRRAILARPERIERVRAALAYAEPLLPHSPAERRVFWVVSLTAGVCEEMLYRGFLFWYLAVWTGPIAAALLSALLFGAGHVYLGPWQIPKTGFIGLLFVFVMLASGSIWPAMLLHAAIDWNSGELGYAVLTAKGLAAPSNPDS
jgi:membrane protease YdiL (CAAX protease family)